MGAGFEPDETRHITQCLQGLTHKAPQIAPQDTGACNHCETCPVTEELPRDLQEVVDAWHRLSNELKAAVLAIVQSKKSMK